MHTARTSIFLSLLAASCLVATGPSGCAPKARTMGSLPCAGEIHANPVDAQRDLKARVAAQPRNSDALLCLAYSQIALKQYAEAIATTNLAFALDQRNALAIRMRAFAKYRSGDFNQAIADAQLANLIAPCGENSEIIGKSYMRLKHYSPAASAFARWAEEADSTEALCWRAAALWESGDQAGALKGWEQAELAAPKDPEPFIWKTGFLYIAGDHAGAMGAAQRAVALAPDSAQALGTLARVQHWQGDLRGAAATVERLAKSNPAAAQHLAEALRTTQPAGKS